MTLRECYTALEGDFEGTVDRLCSEKLVEKFALKFLEDGSYSLLTKAMEEKDYLTAFRASHTLKGVALNLGFTKLFQVSDALTEALRGEKAPEDDTLMEKVVAEYERTVSLLKELQGV